MTRLLILVFLLGSACSPEVRCKVVTSECVDDLQMWTCIDASNQVWYEFSDGTQLACFVTDCTNAADEAAAYCTGVNYTPPED
jgi:hypothetical protein